MTFLAGLQPQNIKQKSRLAYQNFREWFNELSILAKIFTSCYLALNLILFLALIILTPSWIFARLARWAIDLRELTLGPFYLIFFLTLASFPPVIGYGTLTTLCGFTYGWFWGWILASVGSLCGSAISFLILRKNLPRFQHWLSKQPRFAALRQAVAVKGLPLICLIRLCPFPFTYSNLFFASLTSSCGLQDFMIATLATTPKLLLHVFIGARVFHLSDPSSTRHLDNLTIALNIFYIIGGASLGAAVSYYLYQATMAQAGQISLGLDDEARVGTLPGGNRLRTLDEEEDEIRRELLGAEAADSERQWDVEFDDFDQDEEDDHTATLPDSKT
ncbi:hypothetical protein MJO28_007741 [Puccinia striiformis f. sp. tritici]|uniref:Uncharacterized protein n=1 Tax=Puccinia striiformis f. sp. tritici TaxID=168172 RepID=A0ACC0EGU1_9BASI|nr:hypothetical protein Pst134EB_014795 [Puccinia striiformis f. sp. tritici]KAI7952057.1 hypothetical protein MJO28_007741 [Puccinia striiformis f. sp. tritici]KAI7956275.1 hypothetical protein MJO29_007674 [Puccinia striiformis f. sp. tritici]KAI9612897.1 hypothetical protein KEM48_003972 [Puccinia striiformis f. sp. tritici PST-130]